MLTLSPYNMHRTNNSHHKFIGWHARSRSVPHRGTYSRHASDRPDSGAPSRSSPFPRCPFLPPASLHCLRCIRCIGLLRCVLQPCRSGRIRTLIFHFLLPLCRRGSLDALAGRSNSASRKRHSPCPRDRGRRRVRSIKLCEVTAVFNLYGRLSVSIRRLAVLWEMSEWGGSKRGIRGGIMRFS